MDTNITHIRGDTFSRSVRFAGSAGPIDLNGSLIRFSIKKNETVEMPIIQTTLDIINPTEGLSECRISASVMKRLTPGSYVYDMEWTDSNGNVKTVMIGSFIVVYDITE